MFVRGGGSRAVFLHHMSSEVVHKDDMEHSGVLKGALLLPFEHCSLTSCGIEHAVKVCVVVIEDANQSLRQTLISLESKSVQLIHDGEISVVSRRTALISSAPSSKKLTAIHSCSNRHRKSGGSAFCRHVSGLTVATCSVSVPRCISS